jgi:hypothetical protein
MGRGCTTDLKKKKSTKEKIGKQPLAFARGVSCWSDIQGACAHQSLFPIPPYPHSLSWFPSVVGGAPSFIISCPSSFVHCGYVHHRWSPVIPLLPHLFIMEVPLCSLWVVPPHVFVVVPLICQGVVPHSFCGDMASSIHKPPCEQ